MGGGIARFLLSFFLPFLLISRGISLFEGTLATWGRGRVDPRSYPVFILLSQPCRANDTFRRDLSNSAKKDVLGFLILILSVDLIIQGRRFDLWIAGWFDSGGGEVVKPKIHCGPELPFFAFSNSIYYFFPNPPTDFCRFGIGIPRSLLARSKGVLDISGCPECDCALSDTTNRDFL